MCKSWVSSTWRLVSRTGLFQKCFCKSSFMDAKCVTDTVCSIGNMYITIHKRNFTLTGSGATSSLPAYHESRNIGWGLICSKKWVCKSSYHNRIHCSIQQTLNSSTSMMQITLAWGLGSIFAQSTSQNLNEKNVNTSFHTFSRLPMHNMIQIMHASPNMFRSIHTQSRMAIFCVAVQCECHWVLWKNNGKLW